MPLITEEINLPGGTDPDDVAVALELWGDGQAVTGYELGTGITIAGPRRTSGMPWSIADVVGNAAIDAPVGTVYQVSRTWSDLAEPLVDLIAVPVSGGPYTVGELLTDPPGALTSSGLAVHAADTSLHGGGRRLAVAHIATNFATASTSYVDVPGGAITFTVPPAGTLLVLNARNPFTIGEANRFANVRLVDGAGAVIIEDTLRSSEAGQQMTNSMRAPIPTSTWNPAAGSVQTVKMQVKSGIASSTITVFVDFLGTPLNVAYVEAATEAA